MSRPIKNIVGERYGRLVVIGPWERRGRMTYWNCQCDCGVVKFVNSTSLGRCAESCGCWQRESKIGRSVTHGRWGTMEYRVWAGIKQRCNNPNYHKYPTYGGRGIVMCDRWLLFENFYSDMGPSPSPRHTIERLDNDGPYSPENCVWATRKRNQRNRRNTIYVTHNGKRTTLSDLADELGVKYMTLYMRHRKGQSLVSGITRNM